MTVQDNCDATFNLLVLSCQAIERGETRTAFGHLANAVEKLTGICLLLSSSIGDIACRTAQVAAECKRNAQIG